MLRGLLTPALILIFGNVASGQTPGDAVKLTSKDGKEMEVRLIQIEEYGIRAMRGGTIYTFDWLNLDPLCAQAMRGIRWLDFKHDRFDGRSTSTIKDVPFDEDPSIELSGVVTLAPFQQNDQERYSLFFIRVAPDWEWLRYHPVRILVDGQPLGNLNSEIDTEVFSGGQVYENVSITINDQLMDKICAAKLVELKIRDS